MRTLPCLLAVALAMALPPASAADGQSDLDFGFFGRTLTLAAGGTLESEGNFVGGAVAPDGSIFVAAAGRPLAGGDTDYTVTRFTPTGDVDTSFDGDGTRVIALDRGGSMDDSAAWVALRPDGKILLGGMSDGGDSHNDDLVIVQLQTSGAIDNGFGSSGRSIIQVNLGALGFRDETMIRGGLLSNGKIFAVGDAQTGSSFPMTAAGLIVRLNASGVRDTSFSGDGIFTYGGTGEFVRFYQALETPDGGLIACGVRSVDSSSFDDGLIIRVDSAGNLDTSFGVGGERVLDYTTGDDALDLTANCLMHSSGSVYTLTTTRVGVPLNTDLLLDRFDLDGNPFPGFVPGLVIGDAGGDLTDIGYGLREDSQGRIVIAGASAQDGGDLDVLVARLLVDGAPDPDFGVGGRLFRSFQLIPGPETRQELGVALMPDDSDRIHVVGISEHSGGSGFAIGQMRLIGDTIFENAIE